ncbi:MAG TPA: NAD-dependent epimerase/dehydratase family protein [Pseudonocardiaceae bacterium]
MARLLVLGGSWFLGRAVVEDAVARGWEVMTFRRGRSGEDVPGVVVVRGDRTNVDDVRRLAAAGPWDAAVDTSGYVPREVLSVAEGLVAAVGRYVFVSSVSVYRGWPVEPLTEDSPVLECPPDAGPDYGYDADPGPSVYGFGKAGCENAVREVFGADRAVIIRPGVILGPREYVGRLPWWLRRVARGGRVLAPGRPDQIIQPVDVRDAAAFALHTAAGPVGIFNATTSPRDTMETLLTACRQATGSDARFTWVTDEDWLAAQGVTQWTELPLWRSHPGVWAVDSSRAWRAGLVTRPLTSTVADTWVWMRSGGSAVQHERSDEQGIAPEKEAAILRAWDAHEADHRGTE